MTISQTYPISFEGSRQIAILTILRGGKWQCDFGYRFYVNSDEYPKRMEFGTNLDAHNAGEAWARGDSYDEVKKRWKPVAVRSEL